MLANIGDSFHPEWLPIEGNRRWILKDQDEIPEGKDVADQQISADRSEDRVRSHSLVCDHPNQHSHCQNGEVHSTCNVRRDNQQRVSVTNALRDNTQRNASQNTNDCSNSHGSVVANGIKASQLCCGSDKSRHDRKWLRNRGNQKDRNQGQ